MNFKGKSFLKDLDYSKDEILYLIRLVIDMKNNKNSVSFDNKKIAIIKKDEAEVDSFLMEFISSYDVQATVFNYSNLIINYSEVTEMVYALNENYDGIFCYGFPQGDVEEFAMYSKIPIWNYFSESFSFFKSLAIFISIYETFSKFSDLNFIFLKDPSSNINNSLMILSSIIGVNYICCVKNDLYPNEEIVIIANRLAEENNSNVFVKDYTQIDEDIDILYCDSFEDIDFNNINNNKTVFIINDDVKSEESSVFNNSNFMIDENLKYLLKVVMDISLK